MILSFFKRLFAIQVLCLMPLVIRAGGEPDFDKGAAAYSAGDFEKAAGFLRDAARKSPAAGAWHNLGNAEWKCDRPGPAILAWERALWIDPYYAGAKANLQFARRASQLPSSEVTWWEACSMWLPVNAWAWMASVSIWVSVALVVLPGVFRRQKTGWHQGVASAGFALFLISLPALAGVHARSKIGVVLSQETPLRQSPTFEAQILVRLPAGEMVRLQRIRGDYVLVRTGGDSSGWIEKSQVGFIAQP